MSHSKHNSKGGNAMEQRRYSDKEYHDMFLYEAAKDNYAMMHLIQMHEELFDREVEVVKGRKVPIGTKGRVVWMGTRNYGYNWVNMEVRVGILDADGNRYFTNADNVKRI